jgi:hypothetical protein
MRGRLRYPWGGAATLRAAFMGRVGRLRRRTLRGRAAARPLGKARSAKRPSSKKPTHRVGSSAP